MLVSAEKPVFSNPCFTFSDDAAKAAPETKNDKAAKAGWGTRLKAERMREETLEIPINMPISASADPSLAR